MTSRVLGVLVKVLWFASFSTFISFVALIATEKSKRARTYIYTTCLIFSQDDKHNVIKDLVASYVLVIKSCVCECEQEKATTAIGASPKG